MLSPLRSSEILVVDDNPQNCRLITAMLKSEGHSVRLASGGAEAMQSIAEQEPDLILLDVMMPGVSGYEVTRQLKQNVATSHIPVILVTALTDRAALLLGLEAGAEEFLTKPIDRIELSIRVRNLLRLKDMHDQLGNQNTRLEQQVELRTSQLTESCREALFLLTRAAEYRDECTGGHINRISHYCKCLAMLLGLDAEFQQRIYYSSPLHDIGKIGIPDRILLKNAPLAPHEWVVMKTHTTLGAGLLSEGRSDYLRMGADIARHHHERWDGSGYPEGLSGQDIPLPARIMAICDAYDALRSKRPYKEALSHEKP